MISSLCNFIRTEKSNLHLFLWRKHTQMPLMFWVVKFARYYQKITNYHLDNNLTANIDVNTGYWEGIKPGTNARDPGPKSGTKFCQQNIAVKHACIELKFGLNVDYRLFFEMHISIFLHLPYVYYMQVKYRTMLWNTDPGPAFSVLTMSRNS